MFIVVRPVGIVFVLLQPFLLQTVQVKKGTFDSYRKCSVVSVCVHMCACTHGVCTCMCVCVCV